MATDQFHKGLKNVLEAVQTALNERQVQGAKLVNDAREGERATVHVTVSVGQKSESQSFSPEELDDCGQAIDAPAALKVRMLVSHFVI